MSLFKVKAKVLLVSEESMEIEETYDMGNIAKSKKWVWRDISIPFEEVYQITSYDATKSIVKMYDGDKLLVKGTWEELNKLWEDLRDRFTEYAHAEWVDKETTGEEE